MEHVIDMIVSELESPLDAARLAAELPFCQVTCLESTVSTNDVAGKLGEAGAASWSVVVAEAQTGGRGRRGAGWVSPAGRNGIVSVLLRPDLKLPAERWTRLTLAAGLAGCDVMDGIPGLGGLAEIKWPNDIFLSGRKVAGILMESVWGKLGGYVVIGTGFNINLMPGDLPEELKEMATSIWMERGGLVTDRTDFLVRFVQAFERRVNQVNADFEGMKREVWARSWLAGKWVGMMGAAGALEGRVVGLGEEGELLLEDGAGVVSKVASADFVRPV